MNISANHFKLYNMMFFMKQKHLSDCASPPPTHTQKTELLESVGIELLDSEERGTRLLQNVSNHHTGYGYHTPDDCRPNFYRLKCCLHRTKSLQYATLQTPSFATFPLQINVTDALNQYVKLLGLDM
jgi:hypothetical protein